MTKINEMTKNCDGLINFDVRALVEFECDRDFRAGCEREKM